MQFDRIESCISGPEHLEISLYWRIQVGTEFFKFKFQVQIDVSVGMLGNLISGL